MKGASIKYIFLGALMVIFIGALAEGASVKKERKTKGKCQPGDKNCVENKALLSNTKLKTSKAQIISLPYDLPFDSELLSTDASGSGYETDVGSGGETDVSPVISSQRLQELKASNEKATNNQAPGKKRVNMKRFDKKNLNEILEI
ncbi:hypothetical protein XENTR_v10018241 [Xenopus tropicalis]|nr:uncharacterized protein LOC100493999 isoform X2 [Xenopus tropicalis]XP_004915960.1 uncharacterized protein LOC100493999 isoform X2 [Xenopus tropicalis]KAE8590879.1 hypothetical protein XENTR_v10018241 [Xenopus tropicalis]KAE8590880.1 hypothetical protein XENTR_v10018241 [Xenopus tropicalis]KAE8590881.1 hypothetical protein XENTR_v10018241 [Xenopus tropicalis]KAE8590882.1 hypothetical protein XENTR_v10018241 [Xenopus tropicalis]KAE8590883.1 hypothetical protein XENTR_v10018241 [Xenopus trop|eukprot:XP_002936905.2 PREDICTED: uncharacterized protein LOC100493999 isoform X2 [Xenopus tropicalis]